MKTTEKIRRLWGNAKGKKFSLTFDTEKSVADYFFVLATKETSAARMAELLEKAENIMRYYADTDDVIVHPMEEWLTEFLEFQAGEK